MLLDTLKADQMTARKAKNSAEVTFLSTLISEAVSYSTKGSERRASTDEDVLKAVRTMEKGLIETKGNVTDPERLHQIDFELSILQRYMPKMMTEDEVKAAIETIKATSSDPSLKTIMSGLKASYGGRYDGAKASALVKAVLC